MKTARQQFEEEYAFLSAFIRRESRMDRPCRKLLDLLYDIRFALSAEMKKWK